MRSCDCSEDIGLASVTGVPRRPSRSLLARLRSGEAPADDLVQPLRRERVRGAAAQPLGGRQPPDGGVARGQRRRQVLDTVEPRDLLDQVGLARDVGAAEVRNRDVEAVGGVDRGEADRLQQLL